MKKILSMMMMVLVPLWVIAGCDYGGGGGGDGGNGDGSGQDGNGGDNNGGDNSSDLPCQSNSDCPTGWACDLNTNKCKPQGCTTNSDCPSGYYCDLTVYECKKEVCVPNCTGKCCGDDGCGNTCPNNCPYGYVCDLGTCQCKPDVQCTSNADCPQGYYCDLTVNECKEEVCVPNCTGKCCGDDGCGSTCPNNCPTGYTCDLSSCLCLPYCTSDSDCPAMHCCREGSCVAAACGNMQCGYDPVCEFSCGTCPAGYYCNYETGQCILDDPGDLCPSGQECTLMTDGGLMGCIIPPDTIPAGNASCSPDAPCDGNYSCYCMDTDCTEQICIENCGTCPAGLTCFLLWDGGPYACLTSEGGIPTDTPACDPTDYSCAGNATCYQDTSTGNLICLDNCSAQ